MGRLKETGMKQQICQAQVGNTTVWAWVPDRQRPARALA